MWWDSITGTGLGVEVDVDLLEQMTIFTSFKDGSGLCCAAAKRSYKIVADARSRIRDWRHRYFFLVACLREYSKDIFANIERIQGKGAVWWPAVLCVLAQQDRICLDLSFKGKMGKVSRQLPRHADQLRCDHVSPSLLIVASSSGVQLSLTEGSDAEAVRVDELVPVQGAEVPAVSAKTAKAREGSAPRLANRVMAQDCPAHAQKRSLRDEPHNIVVAASKRPRLEIPIQEGPGHGFAFRYTSNDVSFVNEPKACANLVCQVWVSLTEPPLAENLMEADVYKDWAQKTCQAIATANRLTALYERKVHPEKGVDKCSV